MTRSRNPRTRFGWGALSAWPGAGEAALDFNSAGDGCIPWTVASERQEVAVEFFVALPSQPLVQPLRGVIVGSGLEHQSVGLGAFGELPRAIHQGKTHALFTRLRNHVQIAEDPLPCEVQRREHWVQMHEPLSALLMLGIKQHGLAFAQAGEQKTPCRLLIRRPLIELPVGIEQWSYDPHIRRRGLHDFDFERCRVHAEKETRPPRRVNCFVLGVFLARYFPLRGDLVYHSRKHESVHEPIRFRGYAHCNWGFVTI